MSAEQVGGKKVAKAIYDYVATQPGDLSFKAGEIIMVAKHDGAWWTGFKVNVRQKKSSMNHKQPGRCAWV